MWADFYEMIVSIIEVIVSLKDEKRKLWTALGIILLIVILVLWIW